MINKRSYVYSCFVSFDNGAFQYAVDWLWYGAAK